MHKDNQQMFYFCISLSNLAENQLETEWPLGNSYENKIRIHIPLSSNQ